MKKNKQDILFFFLGFILFSILYNKIILSPNTYIFSLSGDASKNYYTFLYYVKYNNLNLSFTGMNYPYGDGLYFVDAVPIYSMFLKLFIGKTFLVNYIVGIFNISLLLNFIFTYYLVYKILNYFKLNIYITLLFTTSIGLLNPQIFRLIGHYALCYSFFIPLIILLFIKYVNHNKIKYLWFMSIVIFIAVNVHIYIGIMLFLLSAVALFWLILKNQSNKIKNIIKMSGILSLPILLTFIIISFFDKPKDRIIESGIFYFKAHREDLFFPTHPPLRPIFDNLTNNFLTNKFAITFEAYSYIGFGFTLLTLFLLFHIIKLLIKKDNRLNIFYAKYLIWKFIFIGAFVCMLHAMLIPLDFFPKSFVYKLPLIPQIRAVGRFMWPIYFIYTITLAFIVNEIYIQIKNHRYKNYFIVFITLLLSINIWEGIIYNKIFSNLLITNKFNYLDDKDNIKHVITAVEKSKEKYDAILNIPVFYIGIDTNNINGINNQVNNSMLLSYHTGIPFISNYSARCSISQATNIINFFDYNYSKNHLFKDIDSLHPNGDKKFIIIVENKNYTITPTQKKLLDICDTILYSCKEFTAYKANFNKIKQLQ